MELEFDTRLFPNQIKKTKHRIKNGEKNEKNEIFYSIYYNKMNCDMIAANVIVDIWTRWYYRNHLKYKIVLTRNVTVHKQKMTRKKSWTQQQNGASDSVWIKWNETTRFDWHHIESTMTLTSFYNMELCHSTSYSLSGIIIHSTYSISFSLSFQTYSMGVWVYTATMFYFFFFLLMRANSSSFWEKKWMAMNSIRSKKNNNIQMSWSTRCRLQ